MSKKSIQAEMDAYVNEIKSKGLFPWTALYKSANRVESDYIADAASHRTVVKASLPEGLALTDCHVIITAAKVTEKPKAEGVKSRKKDREVEVLEFKAFDLKTFYDVEVTEKKSVKKSETAVEGTEPKAEAEA